MITEKKRIYNREYREKNKDKINERMKKYREENKDKILEKMREYREKNREKIRIRQIKRRAKAKAKAKAKINAKSRKSMCNWDCFNCIFKDCIMP